MFLFKYIHIYIYIYIYIYITYLQPPRLRHGRMKYSRARDSYKSVSIRHGRRYIFSDKKIQPIMCNYFNRLACARRTTTNEFNVFEALYCAHCNLVDQYQDGNERVHLRNRRIVYINSVPTD